MIFIPIKGKKKIKINAEIKITKQNLFKVTIQPIQLFMLGHMLIKPYVHYVRF